MSAQIDGIDPIFLSLATVTVTGPSASGSYFYWPNYFSPIADVNLVENRLLSYSSNTNYGNFAMSKETYNFVLNDQNSVATQDSCTYTITFNAYNGETELLS